MEQSIVRKANRYSKQHKTKRWLYRALSVVGACAVFWTTYALILPAITLDKTPTCGAEEHQHNEACYITGEKKILSCIEAYAEQEESIYHIHNEFCYYEDGTLLCPWEELEPHVHTDACWEVVENTDPDVEIPPHEHADACYSVEKGELICEIPESEGHAHNVSCYGIPEEIVICTIEDETHIHSWDEGCYRMGEIPVICELEETAGHVHDDSCWEWHDKLICEVPEEEPANPETEEPERSLICGHPLEEPERVSHNHTIECIVTEQSDGKVLVCKLEEHIHDKTLCFVDEEDGIESEEDWVASLPFIDSDADFTEKLLAVAESQLGYTESETNVRVGSAGDIAHYSRYGAWSGSPYGEWNTKFTAFCLYYADAEAVDAFRSSNAAALQRTMMATDLFVSGEEQYLPKQGDLLFLDSDADGEADRTAIVSYSDYEDITAIEGDVEGQVAEVTYSLNGNRNILGFGIWNPMDVFTEEELFLIEEITVQIAELPTHNEVRETLAFLEEDGDFDGYAEYYREIAEQVKAVQESYDALSEKLYSFIENRHILNELAWLWKNELTEYPVLDGDDAVVSSLKVGEATVLGEDNILSDGEAIAYSFEYATDSYTNAGFREGRIWLEFVLPVPEEQAGFDLSAMEWLDQSDGYEPVVTAEYRMIGQTEVLCQVLTGFLHLSATTVGEAVIPGDGEINAVVWVNDVPHGSEISLLCSAAMEHSTWEGECAIHNTSEKLTVAGEKFIVDASLAPEEQAMIYEAYLSELFDSEDDAYALEDLRNRITDSYAAGELSETDFYDLCQQIDEFLTETETDLEGIAEPAVGDNWREGIVMHWDEEDVGYSTFSRYAYRSLFRNSSEAPMMMSAASKTSAEQIVSGGGGVGSEDGAVYISKTIEGTGIENVFDITLEVVTQDEINTVYEEPDMAVVIVMDISNTMNSNFGGTTRYLAAVEAAAGFLDEFRENAGDVSRIGYVAFNSDAHEIFELQTCNTDQKLKTLKDTMSESTADIIYNYEKNAAGTVVDKKRFTNIEAGLEMARDMLATVNNQNKFIIFLSDGFPTTYSVSDTSYIGYDTYDTSGTRFYDSVTLYNGERRPCAYGTSYSDEAAIRARTAAVNIKESGINIFSIGVDIGGQTIQYYLDQTTIDKDTGKQKIVSHSVVDRRSTTYELGSASSTESFKNWLKGSDSTGIGSGEGYYYDSTNASGLKDAYDDIFEKLLILNGQSSHTDWVATDPMPNMGITEVKTMDFIGFYDRGGNLVNPNTGKVNESLNGNLVNGMYDENTVSYNHSSHTIEWDLKESLYYAVPKYNDELEGDTGTSATEYNFKLKYRVRLKNEMDEFVEADSNGDFIPYDTNAVTSLTYRIIQITDGVTHISEQKTVDFPIPAVKGYLAELEFDKQDSFGELVEGAEFTLSHDTETCSTCRGDGSSSVEIADFVQTCTVENGGHISFTNIPSGHTYRLVETVVPDGYLHPIDCEVVVAYNEITVDGEVVPEDWVVINEIAYELPETGGPGTILYAAGGITMMGMAALLLIHKNRSFKDKYKLR